MRRPLCEFHDRSGVHERPIHIEQDRLASQVDQLTHDLHCPIFLVHDKSDYSECFLTVHNPDVRLQIDIDHNAAPDLSFEDASANIRHVS